MADVRWFAPNAYCALPVPRLRALGLRVTTDGDAPARIAFAADGTLAGEAFRFARRHRARLVLYLWDLPPWRLGSGSPDPVVALGGTLLTVPRPFGRYPGRPGRYSRQRYVARAADQVWCPSAQTTHDVLARFGVEALTVPYCYDSERFRWSLPVKRAGRPVLLSISRLVPHKNHAAVIRAASLLRPEPSVRVIGTGPEAGSLRALAAGLGVDLDLDESWVGDAEIVAAYRASSVVVAPSRFEGFGLTPVEGVALGKPVVASDIPPHREFVGRDAALVPLDDDAALAAAIGAALARDPEQPLHPSGAISALGVEACAARMLAQLAPIL